MDSFLGNKHLCGSIEGMKKCRKKHLRHFILPFLLSLFGTLIFSIMGFLIFCRSKMRSKKFAIFHGDEEDQEQENKDPKYPRISYSELIQATSGFSESSLIGSGRFGRVYKGILRDNTKIAVKVLTLDQISGSFKRECQVLKRTRHRNLIRIITTCSKPDFKALVLPLMSNGSLENHLYPINNNGGLNLVQLVSICSDVAEGVAYLHHHSPIRVVHRDLKPSNILLDNDMTALVTDFGIARLMIDGGGENGVRTSDQSMSCSSTQGLLCGSFGYIAPEYGMGKRASTEGDVFSFGVLLQEVVTGKRPTDKDFSEEAGLSLHEWVKSLYPHKLHDIVEQALERYAFDISNHFGHDSNNKKKIILRDVIMELIELGLMCTQYNPSTRPSMVDVAHEMSVLKEDVSNSFSLLIEEEEVDCKEGVS